MACSDASMISAIAFEGGQLPFAPDEGRTWGRVMSIAVVRGRGRRLPACDSAGLLLQLRLGRRRRPVEGRRLGKDVGVQATQ